MNNDEKILKAIEQQGKAIEQQGKAIEGINNRLGNMQSDITGLKTDITGLKTDITGLKTDITGLKTDITGLKKGQEKLFTAIEPLYKRMDTLDMTIKLHQQDHTGFITAFKASTEGQRDLYEKMKKLPTKQEVKEIVGSKVEAGTAELKADILMLNSHIVRKVQNHEKRIENLEEHTGATNPTKS